MMTQQRRAHILELLRERGVLRVGELAAALGVSQVTIRADLTALEQQGHLTRDHGGALLRRPEQTVPVRSLSALQERAGLNLSAKQRIAREALRFVSPGDTFTLDAGSTTLELARMLSGIASLRVVTNSLSAMAELSGHGDLEVIALGGSFHSPSGSFVGPLAEHCLGELVSPKLFLGTQAFDLEHGLTDSTPQIAQVKRAMIRSARRIILLTDSSKWSHAGLVKVAPLAEIDMIITDSKFPAVAQEEVRNLGVELVLV